MHLDLVAKLRAVYGILRHRRKLAVGDVDDPTLRAGRADRDDVRDAAIRRAGAERDRVVAGRDCLRSEGRARWAARRGLGPEGRRGGARRAGAEARGKRVSTDGARRSEAPNIVADDRKAHADCAELVDVDGIRAGDARCDIDDATQRARLADRNGIRLVGDGAEAERDGVDRRRLRQLADGGAVRRRRKAADTEGRAVQSARRRLGAHRGRVDAARLARRTDRRRSAGRGAAALAEGRAACPRRERLRADRSAVRAACTGARPEKPRRCFQPRRRHSPRRAHRCPSQSGRR